MKNVIRNGRLIAVIALVIIGILSFQIMADHVSRPEMYKEITENLDKKKDSVLMLTVGTTVAANLISAMPDDMGSPLIENLSKATTILLVVQVAIFIEKYMMPIVGYAVFKLVVPIICVMLIISMFSKEERKRKLKQIVGCLATVSVIFFLIVPVSVKLSQLIESTCGQTIENTLSMSERIEQFTKDDDKEKKDDSEEKGFWKKAMDTASGLVDGFIDGAAAVIDLIKDFVGCILEVCVVFIVTSIIIPLATFLIMIKISKLIIEKILKLTEQNEISVNLISDSQIKVQQ